MRRPASLSFAAAALSLASCAGAGDPPQAGVGADTAAATLIDGAGRARASASLAEIPGGVRVAITAIDLAPGAHGAHIHAVGRCDPPDFSSAGSHWNPTDRGHGKENPEGMHKGDLPNLIVGADGRGSVEYVISGVSLAGRPIPMLDDDGAAVVLHVSADDYHTDPSGNSGGRIACGVIG